MTATDKTLFRAFTQAEQAERAKLESRAERLARRVDGIEYGPATLDATIKGLESAAKGSRDGVRAVARKGHEIIKSDDTPAVAWADRKDLKGELHRLYVTGSSATTRKQETTRRSIASATRKADAAKTFGDLRSRYVKGGSIWGRCRNRAQRRTLRAVVNAADKLAESGDWIGACKVLRSA